MGISKPPGYAHPKRRKTTSNIGSEIGAKVKTVSFPKKKKNTAKTPHKPVVRNEKVVFRIGAHPPVRGEITLFDAMKADGTSNRECVLALLRKGSNELDTLSKMSRRAVTGLVYQTEGPAFETNRSLPSDQIEQLRSVFDPHGVMTPRAFGLKVGEATIVLAMKEHSAE